MIKLIAPIFDGFIQNIPILWHFKRVGFQLKRVHFSSLNGSLFIFK